MEASRAVPLEMLAAAVRTRILWPTIRTTAEARVATEALGEREDSAGRLPELQAVLAASRFPQRPAQSSWAEEPERAQPIMARPGIQSPKPAPQITAARTAREFTAAERRAA